LTLQALSACVRYSAQHISMVERGRATATEAFVQACDAELDADGALMRLLPDVVLEQAGIRSARVAARRGPDPPNDREEDGRSVAVLSAAVCEVDPMLPGYWDGLLVILGAHDAAHGPHQVLDTVRWVLRLISKHRQAACGELRVGLMRVEARWAVEIAGDRGRFVYLASGDPARLLCRLVSAIPPRWPPPAASTRASAPVMVRPPAGCSVMASVRERRCAAGCGAGRPPHGRYVVVSRPCRGRRPGGRQPVGAGGPQAAARPAAREARPLRK